MANKGLGAARAETDEDALERGGFADEEWSDEEEEDNEDWEEDDGWDKNADL